MLSQEKVAFACEECSGTKNLATKTSWTAHMKSFHPKVLQAQIDLENTTKTNPTSSTTTSTTTSSTPTTTVSTPSNTTSSTPAPSTSAASTATIASVDPPAPATALTPALTHNPNPTPENDENELSMDSEIMDLWAEVQECVEKLTMDEMEPEKEQENKDELDEKVKRLQIIIAKKNELTKSLKSEKENLKHEVELMKEVIVNKDILLDEKEATINNLKKESTKLEKNLDELNESYNKLLKEKSNLEIVITTKDFIISEIKKVRESQDNYEEEVTEVPRGSSRIEMNKTTSGNLCNFCGKGFRNNRDLERHIQAKHDHTENPGGYECSLCGDGFTIEQEFTNHVLQCIQRTIAIVQCPSCKDNFAKGALKKHQQRGKCTPKTNQVRNHMIVNHRDGEKSRTVCRHWRNGQCLRGDSCMFAHVGFQNETSNKFFTTESAGKPPAARTDTSQKQCFNGTMCIWLARRRCLYFHQEQPRQGAYQVVNQGQGGQQTINQGQGGHQRANQGANQGQGVQQRVHQGQWGQQGGHGPLSDRECWFQERCRRPACHFNHKSLTDFPNLPQSNGRMNH